MRYGRWIFNVLYKYVKELKRYDEQIGKIVGSSNIIMAHQIRRNSDLYYTLFTKNDHNIIFAFVFCLALSLTHSIHCIPYFLIHRTVSFSHSNRFAIDSFQSVCASMSMHNNSMSCYHLFQHMRRVVSLHFNGSTGRNGLSLDTVEYCEHCMWCVYK